MRPCEYCGHENEESATRCRECGTRWPISEDHEPTCSPVRRVFLGRLVGAAVCLFGICVAYYSLHEMALDAKFAEEAVSTKGVIASIRPRMHGVVDYKFNVGTKEYRASGGAGPQDRDFGATVQVFYAKSDPLISSLQPPVPLPASLSWARTLIPVGISGFALCVAMGWFTLRNNRTSQSQRSEPCATGQKFEPPK